MTAADRKIATARRLLASHDHGNAVTRAELAQSLRDLLDVSDWVGAQKRRTTP